MIIRIFIYESLNLSFQESILAKYIVKENKIITEFLGGLFKAIAKRKSSKVMKALSRDPVMKRHIAAADKIGRNIIQHIEKEKKDDPEFAQNYDAIHKIITKGL